jgi:hypothetical protein
VFGTFFKSSWRALPVLVLSPLVAFVVFLFVVDGAWGMDGRVWAVEMSWFSVDLGGGGVGRAWMTAIVIVAAGINFVLLMIIPAAAYPLDAGAKKKQSYLGFFVNLSVMLIVPIVAHTRFAFNPLLFGSMIGLCALSFAIPFVAGSRLVAPAYKRAFWF